MHPENGALAQVKAALTGLLDAVHAVREANGRNVVDPHAVQTAREVMPALDTLGEELARLRADLAAWEKTAATLSAMPVERHLAKCQDALRPFAEVGQWYFALPVPDDEPAVIFTGLNGYNITLTRGHFKAAHSAIDAALGEAPAPAVEPWEPDEQIHIPGGGSYTTELRPAATPPPDREEAPATTTGDGFDARANFQEVLTRVTSLEPSSPELLAAAQAAVDRQATPEERVGEDERHTPYVPQTIEYEDAREVEFVMSDGAHYYEHRPAGYATIHDMETGAEVGVRFPLLRSGHRRR